MIIQSAPMRFFSIDENLDKDIKSFNQIGWHVISIKKISVGYILKAVYVGHRTLAEMKNGS